MDTSRLTDDLDVARGFVHATILALPLWGLVLALWYLLTARGGQS